jgi:hypothetical protein
MSLLWKEVYEYYHPDDDELVVLKRHRVTGSLRRTWYRTGSYYFD